MKSLRFWITATLGWFFFFYNLERLDGPINIASFVYVITVIYAILIIVIPWLQKINILWLGALPLPLFFPLRIWLGYSIGNEQLPFIVTEICALWMTALLARKIGLGLEEFREAGFTLLLVDQFKSRAQPFETGQAEIYREIQRARLYQRPLSLMAVSITGDRKGFSTDLITKEMQAQLIHKYIAARLANLLLEQTNDCDIVTRRNDHFIVLLPEISREGTPELIQKLEIAAREQLGLELSFGLSVFPEEEVTFGKLLERAEANMRLSAEQKTGEQAKLFSAPVDIT